LLKTSDMIQNIMLKTLATTLTGSSGCMYIKVYKGCIWRDQVVASIKRLHLTGFWQVVASIKRLHLTGFWQVVASIKRLHLTAIYEISVVSSLYYLGSLPTFVPPADVSPPLLVFLLPTLVPPGHILAIYGPIFAVVCPPCRH
jgi:hypothetical protein